jgi:hypothetical protein
MVSTIKEYQERPKCTFCNSKKTVRSYQDDLSTLNTSIKLSDSEIKTLGHLANRNSDKMSEDQKIALYKKHNSYKDEPSHKELPSGMSRMKKPKGKP